LVNTSPSAEQVVELATTAAKHQALSTYDIEPALRTLIECDAVSVASAIVRARQVALQRQLLSNEITIYELLFLCRLQARMGEQEDAAKTLRDIYSNPQLSISTRSYACRTLSEIGTTGDARICLRRLASGAATTTERLAIGTAAADVHDWSVARRTFLSLAKSTSMNASCATGLVNAGLKESARKLTSSIDLITNELVWQGGLELMVSCGQPERALEICRDYWDRIDVSL
jgi:hypothetical protein